jgi:1,4-dihydroxy-2-naphthoate octaprenyltransferase
MLIIGLAPGFFAMAILAVNNIRDIETDKKANKKTLPVRFGKSFGITQYKLCIIGASLVPMYFILHDRDHYGLLLTLIVVLISRPIIQDLEKKTGTELNPVLEKTAKLLLFYSLLFILGWQLI